MGRIPIQEIQEIIRDVKGRVGLYIEHLGTGESYELLGDEIFPAASVIKVPVLAGVLKDAEDGRIDLNEKRAIAPVNRVAGSGILADLDPELELKIADIAKVMINMSDNRAANEMIDLLGVDRFHAFCREQGCGHFKWERKMMDSEAVKQGRQNYLQVRETGQMMARIARREFVSAWVSDRIFSYLCSQHFRTKLPALLPVTPVYVEAKGGLKEGTVLCGNKTGSLVGVQHDVGIFELPNGDRYVIAMFMKDLEDDSEGPRRISQVSLAVYNAFK